MKLASMVRLGGMVLGASALAGSASAAEFTVKYTTAVAAVPLSPWMMLGLGVAMAGATALVLHKRGMGQAMALALAGTIGLGALVVAQEAHAIAPTALTLTLQGSGSDMIIVGVPDVDVTVTNSTSSAITITEMNDPQGYYINTDIGREATCAVGNVLPAGGSCVVAFTQIM